MLRIILSGAALAALTVPATAGIVVSVEAPGVTNTTQSFHESGVETFDSFAAGNYTSLVTSFGGTSSYTGTYSDPNAGAQVHVSDNWGDSTGTGNYIVALGKNETFRLDLNKSANYYGFWLSALSSGNVLEFYSGSTQLAKYTYNDFLGIINDTGIGSQYVGSPVGQQTQSEYFAFMNFNFTDGDSYDAVVFSNTGSDGFESDNHTIGNNVPEPATWALMISGFGLVGFAARRRREASVLS